MTFILISSSGTMAMAVNMGYRRERNKAFWLMMATAAFGAMFVSMQVFEWTKLIVEEGVRPWGNPMGAAQFGSTFFMITGFHGLHVSAGVIYLIRIRGMGCTILFLLGQLIAWQQLNASGYFMTSNPANAFFYVLTALHGLHLLGGMWVWGRTTTRVLTGADTQSVRLSVELCTVYWHYLLLVWIGLFALLLST